MSNNIQDTDVERVLELFESVGKSGYPDTDVSVEQWLRNAGATDRMVAVADACLANDFGCSLNMLGLRETIRENRCWDAGKML